MRVVLGPDAQDTVRMSRSCLNLTFYGSELRLRGDAYVSQPHRDDEGNILCWNGEVRRIAHDVLILLPSDGMSSDF